jgi:GNAT superfamily N-acetyltransferase
MYFLRRKMSLKEYHDFPWRIGCKHEYYGGKIHVRPSNTMIVTLRHTLRARTPNITSHHIRPVEEKDARGLIALYRLAFRDAPEFAGWPLRIFSKTARENVQTFLVDDKQPWFSAAHLMKERNRILAAAFILETRIGPIVQPLFVRPSHQRQGLATTLMHHVENRLLQPGAEHLYSHCHLANQPSLAWHYRYGFEELPDEWIAAHRYRYYAHELQRRQRLREISEQEAQELKRQKKLWKAEWARLEAIAKQDFWAAHPLM